MKSRFITFEGIEGSGKSTQAKMLQLFFEKSGTPSILTREPGGTKTAEEIRNLLVNGEVNKFDGITEALLNFAARREHVQKIIKPNLERNKIVISDRFYDSTLAYQGYGQGVDLDVIEKIKQAAIGNLNPDLTFLIDVDVDLSMKRVANRPDNNRYEKMKIEFHKKVRQGFLEIAKQNKNRIVIIDGAQEIEEIHRKILEFYQEQ